MDTLEKSRTITSIGENVETMEFSYIVGTLIHCMNVNGEVSSGKLFLSSSKELNTELTYNLLIPLLSIYP